MQDNNFSMERQNLKDEIKNEMELRKQKDKVYSKLTTQLKKTEKAEATAQKEREKLNALMQEHKALSGENTNPNGAEVV